MKQEWTKDHPLKKHSPRPRFFGATAVKYGFIRKEQLIQALKMQGTEDIGGKPHRLIGMILYDMGLMSIQQINEVHESLTIHLHEL